MKWIKASQRLPAKDNKFGQTILQKIFEDGSRQVWSMTTKRIKDYIKNKGLIVEGWNLANLDWEWLDESDEFISVKERLPQIDEPVLWICENGNYVVDELDKDGNPHLFEPMYFDQERPETYLGNIVTHWCVLPNLNP